MGCCSSGPVEDEIGGYTPRRFDDTPGNQVTDGGKKLDLAGSAEASEATEAKGKSVSSEVKAKAKTNQAKIALESKQPPSMVAESIYLKHKSLLDIQHQQYKRAKEEKGGLAGNRKVIVDINGQILYGLL